MQVKKAYTNTKMEIPENKIELIEEYINQLQYWNTKISLISNEDAKNKNKIWERHINNSMLLLPFIKLNNATKQNIYDIGSGGGLPAIVLAILDENNNYYLVESNSKKTTFLSFTKSELKLNNVTIINKRIEKLSSNIADIVISRALSSLNNLAIFTKHILKPNGISLFIKGESYINELEEFKLSNLYNSFKIDINKTFESKSYIIQMVKK